MAIYSLTMAIYSLTSDQVIALAQQIARGDVRFIAIDYNWGPPRSGRFDTDWMHLWAVTNTARGRGILYLQGKGTGRENEWYINAPFTFIVNITNIPYQLHGVEYSLYHLELRSQYDFPVEFVLRFDADDGSTYYDNNNCQNYKILNPWNGRGLSAIGTDKAIFYVGDILPCRLFWPMYPPPQTR
jgi:hypothetical protein